MTEGFSPQWGDIKARKYSDNSIYQQDDPASNVYRSPAPIQTFSYYNHTSPVAPVCNTMPSWSSTHAYVYGDTIAWKNSSTNKTYLYTVYTPGTSSTTEPAFTGSETSTIADGSTLTWTLIGENDSGRDPRYSSYGWCAGDNYRDLSRNVANYYTDTDSFPGTTVIYNMFNTYGKWGWGAFDINQYNTMMQHGTNWSWIEVNQLSEVGSYGLGYTDPKNNNNWVSSGKMNYVEEWNLSGIGEESPESYYNPLESQRIVWWFAPWQNGGIVWNQDNSKTVSGQQILFATDSTGQDYMYVARNDCTEGDTEPTWAFNETTDVVDGTCHWVFQGKRKFQIGRFIGVDKNHGSSTEEIEYGTLFSAESVIYNSVFDFSRVTFTSDVDDGVHSILRMPLDSFIDMTADGSRAGQNNHLFGYTGSQSWNQHWAFRVKNGSGFKDALQVGDSGYVTYTINSIAAAGSTLSDATDITTPYTHIVTASAGQGVRIGGGVINPGTPLTITNISGVDVRVYPIDGGWNIDGCGAGNPYILHSGQTQVFIYNTNYKNQIEPLLANHESDSLANILALTNVTTGERLYDTTDNMYVTYTGTRWVSDFSYGDITRTQTLSSIRSETHKEGDRAWCHDCRSPGQAAGAGTGRWIVLDSASTWRTEDGIIAAN